MLGVERVPIAGLSDERGLTDKFHKLGSKAASKDERGRGGERGREGGGVDGRVIVGAGVGGASRVE